MWRIYTPLRKFGQLFQSRPRKCRLSMAFIHIIITINLITSVLAKFRNREIGVVDIRSLWYWSGASTTDIINSLANIELWKSSDLDGNILAYQGWVTHLQYITRIMHAVFALLCFVVAIHWLIFPYPSGLLHWHYGNLTIAPVPAKQPWWIWINTSCEFIMNYCITTTKQSTTKPCAYFLGYTVIHQLI